MKLKWMVILYAWLLFLCTMQPILAQTSKPSPTSPLVTRWGKGITAENILSEYPRPMMMRSEWLNLNGLWDFGVTRRDQTNVGEFAGKILVPFPAESLLSGIKHLVTEQQRLWYRCKFAIPQGWLGRRVLLHFEAVDYETRVWVNGKEKGVHQGGYDRFSFDITDVLQPSQDQGLTVSVFDPTDGGFQPHGKQLQHPYDLFYTGCSGIWQSVWLEPVPATYFDSLKLMPDIGAGVLKATGFVQGETNGVTITAVAWDGTNKVGQASGGPGQEFQLPVPNAKLWSPDSPFLYDLKLTLSHNGQKLDEISSYFGMRQISVARDESGFPRLMLNHQRVFQLGPLDHGYWPDGLYTAPSDEALRSDIEGMKQLGFNMCRKHVKIEPERWYYWCDKLGLLVWQDMPSGDRSASAQHPEIERQPESAREFETELKRMVVGRGNHPSIVVWIPFNQGWGQYDTVRITSLVKQWDPSRLIIDASGWYDMDVGDIRSLHQYPGPAVPLQDGKRACVLGECGALALKMPSHIWRPRISSWNATKFDTIESLTAGYEELMTKIQALEETKGLSGAVITQWSDVETSCDGFVTYDREVLKMPVERIRAANEKVINARIEPAKAGN